MGLSFGAPITTNKGTAIITRAGSVLVVQIKTAAGTKIFSSTTTTKFAAGAITGFKTPVHFGFTATLATNLTTYASIPSVATVGFTNKFAPIPWAGSVLGFGVRAQAVVSAGHATFTVMDGTTGLAGTTLTLNTTDTSSLDLTLLGVSAKTFKANRLRVRIKTSADLSGLTRAAGIVWVEV